MTMSARAIFSEKHRRRIAVIILALAMSISTQHASAEVFGGYNQYLEWVCSSKRYNTGDTGYGTPFPSYAACKAANPKAKKAPAQTATKKQAPKAQSQAGTKAKTKNTKV